MTMRASDLVAEIVAKVERGEIVRSVQLANHDDMVRFCDGQDATVAWFTFNAPQTVGMGGVVRKLGVRQVTYLLALARQVGMVRG